MFITYGTKGKIISSKAAHLTCTTCGGSQHTMHVVQRYFNIFWIPVIPLRKTVVTECGQCRKVSESKELEPQSRGIAEQARKSASTPAWTFSGLGVAIVLGLSLWALDIRRQESVQAYIRQPVAGDIVVYKSNGKYRVLKITEALGETVQIRPANYEYDHTYGALKHMRRNQTQADYFSNELLSISLEEFRQLEIDDIKRGDSAGM